MWMLVMFDLPVETKAQMKAATAVRNFLLDEGFERSRSRDLEEGWEL